MPLKQWLKAHKQVGKESGYTTAEIEIYGCLLRGISQALKKRAALRGEGGK